jgi:hypothetical protein
LVGRVFRLEHSTFVQRIQCFAGRVSIAGQCGNL